MTFESPSSENESAKAGAISRRHGQDSPQRVAILVDHFAEMDATGGDPAAPAQSTARIMKALETLGYEPVELRLEAHKIAEWLQQLMDRDFEFAFNLCETIGGRADGEYLVAAAVELLDIPMTGASAATLHLCLHKDRCSAILRAHGIAVPDWIIVDDQHPLPDSFDRFPAIVKPAAEDASNGVHSSSVVHSHSELVDAVKRLSGNWEKIIIQQFIDGREINLAIIGDCLLPPAEIDFSTLPEDAPPIVSFSAKWRPESSDFQGTIPICPAPIPPEQAEELQRLAGHAWSLMDGRGYARVDVRLAADGTPYVIDINPNPDLSYDAGLARQARVVGWSYDELIEKVVDQALGPEPTQEEPRGWKIMRPAGVGGGVG